MSPFLDNSWAEAMGWSVGIMFVLLVWSAFWKALALWHSARRGQPWWFVIFIVVNTAGLLELIYLFGVAKIKFHQLFKK